jgi:hypothetical protein
MVTFSQVLQQWPWNPQAIQDFSDVEILTHWQSLEDKSKEWYAPLYPCLPGYAFVGYRVVSVSSDLPTNIRLQIGNGFSKPHTVFGPRTDAQKVKPDPGKWTLFRIPITHRMCAFDEDELHLRVEFHDENWGKVEMMAKRIDELPQEEIDAEYWYPSPFNPEGGWIYTPRGSFYWLENHVRLVEYPNAIVVPHLGH